MEEPEPKADPEPQQEVTGPAVNTSSRDAKVIYVDDLYHLVWSDNVVKLAFVQYFGDPYPDGRPVQLEGKHTISIAMPIDAMVRMSDYLQSSIQLLREQGIVK